MGVEETASIQGASLIVEARYARLSSTGAGENRGQLVRRNHFELGISAVGRFLVHTPPSKMRHVPEAGALHVLVSDFGHELGPQRLPR